ncbi:MAG: alpha/beta hydrolase [Methanobrevibacter sp.]|nr:alpha/beta hydrolase [Methanobrevibacter sp.]
MEINYLLEGSGENTIVFIHGLSDNLYYWQRLSFELSKNYKVLSYDLRGHGSSPYAPFTMDELADDLHDLLLSLDIAKTSLVGLSLGGNVALLFALKYPQMVEKLVIMSSFSQVDDNLRLKFEEFKTAIGNSYEDFYDVIIKYVLPEDILNENREALELYKKEAAKSANIKAIENGIDIGVDFYITDKLKCLNHPALILAGRDDEITHIDLSEILNENIENSQLIIFENTKHNLLIKRNMAEIIKILREFL